MQIPPNTAFTQLIISAAPAGLAPNREATLMLANFGKSPPVPTSDKYSAKAESAPNNRIAIMLQAKRVVAGDWIHLLVVVPPLE
jgi:hypothetical protein